jgi:osmotically-inducible protein OsmY
MIGFNRLNSRMLACSLAVALLLLGGCTNVAMTGAQAVYNRHSLQKSVNDQYITMEAYKGIQREHGRFKDANISVATFNGDVLLAGQVPESWQRAQAERIVKHIDNVKHVYNLVTVASPSSALVRISDTWITTKIKAKLIACNDVDATQIKVMTENGTVYLMGILPPSQAQAAVELASETDGVSRVVKIFSYIRISKT